MVEISRAFYVGMEFFKMQQSTSIAPKCIVLDTVKGQGVPEIEEFGRIITYTTSEQRDI